MCRKEMGPLEDMPEQESESEYSDSDESRNTEQVAEDERNVYYAAKARKHYAGLGDDAPAAAAKKIQSIIRMFLARSAYRSVIISLWVVKTSEKYLVTQRQTLRMDISRMRVGRVAWRIAAVTLIQAVWRDHRARKAIKAKKCIAVKKIQALWRGYYLRKPIHITFSTSYTVARHVTHDCWVTFTRGGCSWVTAT